MKYITEVACSDPWTSDTIVACVLIVSVAAVFIAGAFHRD